MNERRSRVWNPQLSAAERAEVDRLAAELPAKATALRVLRETFGLSQSELAEMLGRTQSSVSKLEAGRDVRIGDLRRVIEARGGRMKVLAEIGDTVLELPV